MTASDDRDPEPEGPARADSKSAVYARLFDADRTDRRLELSDAVKARIGANQLLWIDATGPIDAGVVAELDQRLKLGPSTAMALTKLGSRPHIAVHGSHLHLRVLGEPGHASGDIGWIDILVAPNLVITVHAGQAGFLDRLDDRIRADATVGRLTSASFLRLLLDAVVTTYFKAVDAIEDEVDDLDARSLLASPDEDILPDLVEVRRRITRLRRLLSDHREVYAALGSADVSQLADGDEGFGAVAARFEEAIHSVEDSRDLLLGSFDVFMSRLAQRTNDAMKVLALATVLLLPGSLIAGLLGMNVTVPLSKDDVTSFWIVVAGIAVLALLVLAVAWRIHWIRIGGGGSSRAPSGGAMDLSRPS
jgi:magnesium transporter